MATIDDQGLAVVVEPPAGTAHLTLLMADTIDSATLCGRWTLDLERRTHAAPSCRACVLAAQDRSDRITAAVMRALAAHKADQVPDRS